MLLPPPGANGFEVEEKPDAAALIDRECMVDLGEKVEPETKSSFMTSESREESPV